MRKIGRDPRCTRPNIILLGWFQQDIESICCAKAIQERERERGSTRERRNGNRQATVKILVQLFTREKEIPSIGLALTFKLIGWRREFLSVSANGDQLERQMRRRRVVVVDAFKNATNVSVG